MGIWGVCRLNRLTRLLEESRYCWWKRWLCPSQAMKGIPLTEWILLRLRRCRGFLRQITLIPEETVSKKSNLCGRHTAQSMIPLYDSSSVVAPLDFLHQQM